MSDGKHKGALGAVYSAKGPDEIAALYDGWAEGYDAEMARAGYRHPSVCLALLARHLPKGEGPVLDAGAGTGILGEWLGLVGYPEADALDLSEGMLAVAARKGVYRQLHRLALGGPLPFADGAYAAVVAAGVFTTGHVGAEALPELIRITRPGGPLVLTVKLPLWEESLEAALAALPVTVAERSEPYVSMPGEAGTVASLALVLRRT